MIRSAAIHRATSETDIRVGLMLDGAGKAEIATGIGFLDHMLTAFARHSLFDLSISAKGDLEIDGHHTTEDVGIALGQALREALGEKRGITRFGHALVPMDEALVEAAVDLSGRPHLSWAVEFPQSRLGTMETELFREFFSAVATNALLTLHLIQRGGENTHHLAEATFKAAARALRIAVALDPRQGDLVPSTKGRL
ncbi:MAG: imidazoleglycerol-phosphate dehydratase HisB [Acetobacteraceae bacterium]